MNGCIHEYTSQYVIECCYSCSEACYVVLDFIKRNPFKLVFHHKRKRKMLLEPQLLTDLLCTIRHPHNYT